MAEKTGLKYIKRYGIIFAACVFIAALFSIIYKLIKSGSIVFAFPTFLKILLIGTGLFVLFFVELQVTKWIFRSEKGYVFHLKEFVVSVFLSFLVLVCFLPVVSDYAHRSFPVLYSSYFTTVAKYDKNTAAAAGQIIKGKTVSQTFICPGGCLYSLTFMGGTYRRLNHGTLHIELLDEDTGEVILLWDRPAEEFSDNSDFTVYVDPFKYQDLSGHHMRVNFTSADSVDGDAITLYYSKEDCYEDGILYFDDDDSGGDLILSLETVWNQGYQKTTKVWLCFFLAAAVEGLVLFLLRRRTARHLTNR